MKSPLFKIIVVLLAIILLMLVAGVFGNVTGWLAYQLGIEV